MLAPLTKEQPGQARLSGDLESLRAAMERVAPDRSAIARQAGALAKELDNFGTSQTGLKASSIRSLMRTLAADGAARARGFDWDQATQYYLALEALDLGLGKREGAVGEGVRAELKRMRGELKASFEPGYNSPRQFGRKAQPFLADHLSIIGKLLEKD
jgi:hypothetical protein